MLIAPATRESNGQLIDSKMLMRDTDNKTIGRNGDHRAGAADLWAAHCVKASVRTAGPAVVAHHLPLVWRGGLSTAPLRRNEMPSLIDPAGRKG